MLRPIYVLFSYLLRTLCNSCMFRGLPCLESWPIQNQEYIQNSVKAYSCIFRTLCNAGILRTLSYLEFWHIQHIQDLRHIQNPVYLGIFRHIQAYSIIIITLNLFFHFNLACLSTKFKKSCFSTTMTLILMLVLLK